MSNAKTGIWSALGALLGGVAGAQAGRYAAMSRPRSQYGYARQRSGGEIEDAMVVGAAAGAVGGAFLAGTIAGEETPPPNPQLPK